MGDMPARWNGKCTGDDSGSRRKLNGENTVEVEALAFWVDAMSVDGSDRVVPMEFLDRATGRGILVVGCGNR